MSKTPAAKPDKTADLQPWGALGEYMTDAMQRTVLFWDVMRQRSDQYYKQKAKDCPARAASSTPSWCWTAARSTSPSTTCWCASSRRPG